MVGRIAGATRNLGAPPGWERDKHGTCGGLPIRDEMHAPGLPRMVSAWIPTPQEIALLQAGAPVYLTIIGGTHPPVSVGVGLAPRDAADLPDPHRLRPYAEEAVGIANAVQADVADHKAPAIAMALGWVAGAVAACGSRGLEDLDDLLADIRWQARLKFEGVRDGTWPDASSNAGGK